MTRRGIQTNDPAAFGAFRPSPPAAAIIGLSRLLSRSPVLSTRRFFRFLLGRVAAGPFDVCACGVRIRSHPWDNTSDGKLLLTPRHYCPKEFRLLGQALSGGGVFIDIGANIGAFTLQAARRDGVRVLAIEPHPVATERLGFNVEANAFGNVTIVETVIGDRKGETHFTFVHDSIGKSGIGSRGGGGRREVRRLAVRTLSEVLAEHAVDSIAALKADVEGHEDAVLMPFFESAKRRQWPRLLIIEDNRLSPSHLLPFLEDHGYVQVLRTRENVALALPP